MSNSTSTLQTDPNEIPQGDAAGFVKYLKYDFVSGLLVFLIALPLCLGIAIASGFPAIAGVFTAIVGSVIVMFFSNAELTIKGPAAGLIVIVLGAVTEFGFTGGTDANADFQAYRMALAIGVVAGVLQIGFGIVRAGILGDFFPTSVVHGMLAAIGVIIMLKQLPVALGESVKGDPIEMIRQLPEIVLNANPEIAFIGLTSLLILFGLGYWKSKTKNPFLKKVPAQLIVLLFAIPMGWWLDLSHQHTYSMFGHEFELSDKFLVNVPSNLAKAITHPDFNVLTNSATQLAAVKWVFLFALIGSLESMLSAKAIDMLDPWKRKTNLNRDLIGVGIANTIAAAIGGLPMISEIVRSKANIDNGARTRFANFWHGVFLLVVVAFLPGLVHRVPLAALAAMLVHTGFRLASPREFLNVYKIGKEQLIIFVSTLVAVLMTDLLVGIAIGIVVKLVIHLVNGLPLSSIFKPYLEVEQQGENSVLVVARGSAVFTNFIPFKRQIEQLGLINRNNVIIDFSSTQLVDHTVMEKLHEMQIDFEQEGLELEIQGLESHKQMSAHPLGARRKGMTRLRRLTVVTDQAIEQRLVAQLRALGATGYTSMDCRGLGRSGLASPDAQPIAQVRLEVIAKSSVIERIIEFAENHISADTHCTLCVETVEVNRHAAFD